MTKLETTKKIYQTPQVWVVEIGVQSLMAGSPSGTGTGNDGGGYSSDVAKKNPFDDSLLEGWDTSFDDFN